MNFIIVMFLIKYEMSHNIGKNVENEVFFVDLLVLLKETRNQCTSKTLSLTRSSCFIFSNYFVIRFFVLNMVSV